MIDEFGRDARILKVLFDELGVLLIDLLCGGAALAFLVWATAGETAGPKATARANTALPRLVRQSGLGMGVDSLKLSPFIITCVNRGTFADGALENSGAANRGSIAPVRNCKYL